MKSHLEHHLHLASQTRVLIIGLHTMIATNLNLLTSCTVAIKCRQGISIPFLISGLLLLQHMVRNHHSATPTNCTIQLTQHLWATFRGKTLPSHMMETLLTMRGYLGWMRSMKLGSEILSGSSGTCY